MSSIDVPLPFSSYLRIDCIVEGSIEDWDLLCPVKLQNLSRGNFKTVFEVCWKEEDQNYHAGKKFGSVNKSFFLDKSVLKGMNF